MFFILSEVSKLDLQMQRWMFSTSLVTLLVVAAKWISDNVQVKKAAKHLANKAEQAKQEIKSDIKENTDISRTAFSEANALNQKIFANQKIIEAIQARQTEQDERIAQLKAETEAQNKIIIERLDGKRMI